MKTQRLFWFATVELTQKPRRACCVAVAAPTKQQAARQVRKAVGKGPIITHIDPILYSHAWVIDMQFPAATGERQEPPK